MIVKQRAPTIPISQKAIQKLWAAGSAYAMMFAIIIEMKEPS